MRWARTAVFDGIALLAACSSAPSNEPCDRFAFPDEMSFGAGIASGTSVAGITWREQIGNQPSVVHGAFVQADGTLSFDIHLATVDERAIAGASSVLWYATEKLDCNQRGAWLVTLHGARETTHLDLAPAVRGVTATFDGDRYQLFWLDPDRRIHHRWLAEDGVLGPERDLQLTAGNGDFSCINAASDGAGTTILVEADGYVVDGETGARRLVFDGPLPVYGAAFYFAGQYHVRSGDTLYAFPATSTGAYTTRRVPDELSNARAYHPASNTLFVDVDNMVVEVDAALTVLRRLGAPAPFGTLGPDLVQFVHTAADRAAGVPGKLELMREHAWTVEVAPEILGGTIEQCN